MSNSFRLLFALIVCWNFSAGLLSFAKVAKVGVEVVFFGENLIKANKKISSYFDYVPLQVIPICVLLFVCFFFMAVPSAYRSSQAKDLIRAAAAGLNHRHSHLEPELCLQPTPQLTEMLDP